MADLNDSWRAGGKGNGAYILQALTTTQVPLIVKGVSGQIANLFEAQNSAGTVVFSVDNSGNLTFSGSGTITIDQTITGNLTVNGNTTLGNNVLDTLTVNSVATFVNGSTFGTTGSPSTSSTFKSNLTVNSNLAVLGNSTFTGYVSVTGDLSTNSSLYVSDGTAAIPSISFKSNVTTGIYRSAANTIGFTAAGTSLATWTTGLLSINAGDVSWSAGVAVTAARYSISRDADGTNQLHFNVPTGAGFEASINDVAVLTINSSGDVGIGASPTSRLYVIDTIVGGEDGASFQITGSGSASSVSTALKATLLAGYTGSSGSFGVYAQNKSVGSATNEFTNVQAANYGEYIATTAGTVVGQAGYASGGDKSYGGFFRSIITKAGSTNIGIGGFASNGSNTEIGGFFGLMNSAPTFASAALIADNGATTNPIFLVRDNGSTVFSIIDGGNVALTNRMLQKQGVDVASANDLTLGGDGNTFEITGTTQINAITTTSWQNGAVINLLFTSTPTVKHNTAGGANTAVILLAASGDFSATGGDVLSLVLSEIGGTQAWRETGRTAI